MLAVQIAMWRLIMLMAVRSPSYEFAHWRRRAAPVLEHTDGTHALLCASEEMHGIMCECVQRLMQPRPTPESVVCADVCVRGFACVSLCEWACMQVCVCVCGWVSAVCV